MRNILTVSTTVLALCCTMQVCSAQEAKTTVLSDGTTLNYTLNDSKKLDGLFSVSESAEKVFLRGVYKNGERVGNWYAFNTDGGVFMRYNYDQKKLVYIDTTSVSRLTVEVLAKDQTIREKASIPVPVASVDEYISLLATELKRQILRENKDAEGELTADLVAYVDKNGVANYEGIYKAAGIPVTKRLILTEKYFDLDWIPASYDGKNYASTFKVKAKIDFSEKESGKKRFTWAY